MDLNLRGGGDLVMRTFSSSPTSLSDPPSSHSTPASPSRLNVGRANIEMDEIVVDTASGPRFGVMAPPQPPPPDVPLTAAGVPRKKPGRKPGSTVKPKVNPDGTPVADAPKVRKPRKPRDPNAPPIQRKRKIAATQDTETDQSTSFTMGTTSNQPKITELTSMRMDVDPRPPVAAPSSSTSQQPNPPKVPKREGISSMMSLLNRDPSPPPPPIPAAPGRMAFDPVRSSSYDPVRETMVTRDPYGTAGLASPRAPSQMTNRASASPSISSLVDPPVASKVVSPTPANSSFKASQFRYQEPASLPPSPPDPVRKDPPPMSGPAPKSSTVEIKKPAPHPMPQPPKAVEPPKAKPATISGMAPPATASAPSKKVAAVVAQTRKEKQKASSSSSSPKMGSLKNALPDIPPLPGTSTERSILDFGRVAPGEEMESPSIVLHIPLNGETNKYINFMRLAEDKYGWEALHPRQAADRERKARIAAASAALEKQQSGRDSAEEEDPEFDESEGDNSNVEMGGMGNNGGLTSGAEAVPDKPKRKKRNWREDEYDKQDDFVDDSELLWEEQAAAVKDGFFVYSGPLVPEVAKPPASDGNPKRGRGGRRGGGPGSRGGRGAGEGGRGRGGGPGSRGGTTRKPRITKLEKQNLEREKAEREKMGQMVSASKTSNTNNSSAGSYGLLQGLIGPTSVPSLSAGLGAGLTVNQ